jgi:uncharacterized RDD family membrane protein YckC
MRVPVGVTTVSTMSDDTTPPQDPGPGATPPPPPPGGTMPPPPPPPPPPAYGDYVQPPPMQTGPQPGGLGARFVARLVDGILVAIVQGLVVSLLIVRTVMDSGTGFYGTDDYAASAVYGVLSALIYVGYFAYMESSRGQTIGKMVMNLHTQGPDGGLPTMEQAVRRNLWGGASVLSIVPVIGGSIGGLLELVAVIVIAVTINGDPVSRQGWHDRFAGGTRVVRDL